MPRMVRCNAAMRGKCQNKQCVHYHEHKPDEFCRRFGYCRNWPALKRDRPVAYPRMIEVRCM